MLKSETYQAKHRNLKIQFRLYDEFLRETELTFEERSNLIYEMGRTKSLINQIENMSFKDTKEKTDDYPKFENSSLNYETIVVAV